MPRIARIVAVGYPHHVIQRGNNRQAVFFNDADRQFYLGLVKKYSSECSCKIHVYCLMDNHIHLLVVPSKEDSLAKTMQKLSLRYTQYINKKYKRTGRLWECRFHSTLVENETYLWVVSRYIERNPVRAKVVKYPGDYRWSSAIVNTSEKKDDLVEPIWQNLVERKEYTRFLNTAENEDEIKNIRRCTYSGKPLATEGFLNSLEKRFGITVATRPRGRPKEVKNGMCP